MNRVYCPARLGSRFKPVSHPGSSKHNDRRPSPTAQPDKSNEIKIKIFITNTLINVFFLVWERLLLFVFHFLIFQAYFQEFVQ